MYVEIWEQKYLETDFTPLLAEWIASQIIKSDKLKNLADELPEWTFKDFLVQAELEYKDPTGIWTTLEDLFETDVYGWFDRIFEKCYSEDDPDLDAKLTIDEIEKVSAYQREKYPIFLDWAYSQPVQIYHQGLEKAIDVQKTLAKILIDNLKLNTRSKHYYGSHGGSKSKKKRKK